MTKNIDVTFKSISDFRSRIAALCQSQKEDEKYNFIFECPEAEREFDKLMSCFSQDMERERT